MVTRAAVAPGDELLVDYDSDFWDQQRLFRRDVARLSGIVAREEADGGRRKRRPLCPAEAATAAKDALFVWALWVRRRREGAHARAAVRRAERREAARARFLFEE